MHPEPRHPSRPLLMPLMVRAQGAIRGVVRHSRDPEEDHKNLVLLVDQFYRTLRQVIELLDPYGEKLHQYQDVLDVEHYDQHFRERCLQDIETDDEDDELDAPDSEPQPASAKFREAAEPLLGLLHLTPLQRERIETIFDEHYQHIDALTRHIGLMKGFVAHILEALTPDEQKRVMALIRKTAEEPDT